MITLHQTSSREEEQERILATFRAGNAMCKAALHTALYAIVTLLLAIIHIFTFVINFSIGALTIMHAICCMIRMLLVQCQELTANPLNTIERRNER
jgi:hypothetical protein